MKDIERKGSVLLSVHEYIELSRYKDMYLLLLKTVLASSETLKTTETQMINSIKEAEELFIRSEPTALRKAE